MSSLVEPAESPRGGMKLQSPPHTGVLIINADDWGMDRNTTDRIAECIVRGAVSSTSAMVFMEDSERAAAIATERGIDAGLHLNLTSQFSGRRAPFRLIEQQQKLAKYLRRHRLTQIVFHPGLANAFRYVVSAQLDEFNRLYGKAPSRLDGHHHMHLCANVVLGHLIPEDIAVRRNSSFAPGEKGFFNRMYRRHVDNLLAKRHSLPDFLYLLPPLEPSDRLRRIFALARTSAVEVETHPINPEEYKFLAGGEIFELAGDVPVAKSFALPPVKTQNAGDSSGHGKGRYS